MPHIVINADKCMATGSLSTGQCWTDAQCPSGSVCENASACGCKANCKAADKPGTCTKPPACAKLDPSAYGTCEKILGIGWDGTKCVSVSGCDCKPDCDKIFTNKAACEAACTNDP